MTEATINREKLYNRLQSDDGVRQSLVPYLTEQDDPYFDPFLAITCFYLPDENAQQLGESRGSLDEVLAPLRKASICEIGKWGPSKSFRLFGKDYLAVSDMPDLQKGLHGDDSEEEYGGTVVEKLVDLRYLPSSSLADQQFDISLSNSLIGEPHGTHLLAGRPIARADDEENGVLAATRNILATFSNMTSIDGLSVHRCDGRYFKRLSEEGYISRVGFDIEAALEPEVAGGFFDENDIIVVLRKNHDPADGEYDITIGDNEFLRVVDRKCKVRD